MRNPILTSSYLLSGSQLKSKLPLFQLDGESVTRQQRNKEEVSDREKGFTLKLLDSPS